MTSLLTNKVAAITGGVTGIGRAIALAYLRHGARVVVNHYPDPTSAAHFQDMLAEAGPDAGASLIAVPGDIALASTATELVETTVRAFGRLDVFVSNAGVCQFQDFLRYVG